MSDSSNLQNIYFREISGKKQLEKQEEYDTFFQLDELKKKNLAFNELASPSTDEIVANNKVVKQIDKLKTKLIESQYFLVIKIAKKYRNRHLTLFDMIEEGNLALVNLIDKFKFESGFRLSTFVYPVVKNAILKSVLDKGSMIREPIRNSYGNYQFSYKSVRGLNDKKQLKPFSRSNVQIGVDSSRWLQVVKRYKVYSFDDPVKGMDNLTLGDTIPDGQDLNSVETNVMSQILEDHLLKFVDTLTPQEKEIITHYYGLENVEPISFIKIGERLNKSAERIRQLHNQAIEKLKNCFNLI